MNSVKSLARYQNMFRNFSTTRLCSEARDLTKLKENQRRFQVDDGVPVYLKKGASDRVAFGFLVLGLAFGLAWSAATAKRIIFPKPNE